MFSTSPITPTALTLGLAGGQRQHRAGDGGGPAHVAFHAHHAGAGLERQAAGIKAHALADECDGLRLSFARAVPLHDHSWLSRSLPWPTPSSAPMPSFFISASPSTSTFTPSLASALARRANSSG